MDKLQPLIKHRYWICFALATIFVITAWFLASGQLAAEIDARTASVKGSFDKSGQGKDQPNQKWVEDAKKKNEADSKAYKSAATALRERQISARQWPELIRDEMKGIAYQEQIQNQLTREKWAANYRDEVESLLDIVKPWRDGKGLVVVDSNRITHRPYNTWRTKNPQSREIWDAQEDIWLLRSLLTSIATANGTAERITESAVREIYRLHLRGGDRNAAGASSGGAGGMGGMGGMGESGGMSPMGAAAGPGGMGGMGAGEGAMGGGGSASHPGASFMGSAGSDILAEEFGAVAGAGGGMGGMGGMGKDGGMDGGPGMMSMGGMGAGAMGAGMAGGGAAAAPAEEDRYVDEVPESYKTRAFLLDVLVRDDRVPDLLAALTDSDFPVEIVRVEIEANTRGGAASGGMSGLGGEDGLGEMTGAGGMAGMGGMPNLSGYPGAGGGGSKGLTGPPAGGGIGGAPGLPGLAGGGGLMGPGAGFGEGEGSGSAGGLPGGAAYGTQSQRDAETLRIAMTDNSLVMLRIGGLMTLYQSAEEAKSAEATEAAAETETTAADGSDPASTQPGDPSAPSPSADPNAPPAADAPTEGDPTAPAQPADPSAPPVDPSAPPADPSAPPAADSATPSSTPPADPSAAPPGDSSPGTTSGDAPPQPAAPGQ